MLVRQGKCGRQEIESEYMQMNGAVVKCNELSIERSRDCAQCGLTITMRKRSVLVLRVIVLHKKIGL